MGLKCWGGTAGGDKPLNETMAGKCDDDDGATNDDGEKMDDDGRKGIQTDGDGRSNQKKIVKQKRKIAGRVTRPIWK